jgi:hypothetical protein
MDFTHVVCTVVILLSPNNRDVVSLHGTVVKEIGDYFMVDFSREFVTRKYRTDLQTMVQKINNNDCLYEK